MKQTLQCPTYIIHTLQILHKNHVEAFLVGGCVRDLLLHRIPNDYDITTSATPDQVIAFFTNAGYKVIPTGIKHGTVSVQIEEHLVEITTYRIEQDYQNHRSPSTISFTTNLEDDLSRRDFTINAIAYDIKTQTLIDPFHGIDDLQQNIIRCVNDPNLRFQEDALRILRAIRFSFQLHFSIEECCKQAILEHSSSLSFLSKERIRDEFNKMLATNQQDLLLILKEYQVLQYIIPQLQIVYDHKQHTPWHCYDIFTHTNVALNHCNASDLHMKLALILHDIGKVECEVFDDQGIAHYPKHAYKSQELAKQALQDLRYDNKTIKKVCQYILYHDYYVHPKPSVLRKYLAHFDSYSDAIKVLQIQRCDNYAKHPSLVKQLVDNVTTCEAKLLEIIKHHDYVSRSELAITGYDIKALGYEGSIIKKILDKTFAFVTKYPEKNNKTELIHYIKTSNFQ